MSNLKNLTDDDFSIAMEKVREKNKEAFFKKCNEINGDTIDISNFIYTGNRNKSLCKCKICGYEWQDMPERLYIRKNCPKCQKNINGIKKKERNLLKYKEKAEELCTNKNISDIEFFYGEKGDLMVKFYCHGKYCDGTEHGEQIQTGHYFLKNFTCAKCGEHLCKAYTSEEWVRMAKNKYPEFLYDKTVYIDKETKVIITCPKHGDVLVVPKAFMYGTAYCPECTKERLHGEFVKRVIERAKKKHNNENYIYHPELITKSTEKMGIECKKHGIFWQSISNHVNKGSRCPKCVIEEYVNPSKYSFEEVVKRTNEIHNNKYTYHKDAYIDTMKITLITCPIHGDFKQTMHNHLGGQGCPKCGHINGGKKNRLSQEEFIIRVEEIHKHKGYDFSKSKYTLNGEYVTVTCPKHGDFDIKAGLLLNGCGCPICNMSKLETAVRNQLIDNNILYESQKRFSEWLGYQSLDFYLPDYNIGIECQGSQHFINERMYNKLDEVKERDEKKKRLCCEHNVKLIYYVPEYFSNYMKKDDIFFTDVNEMIKYVKNCK